ncbi:hypothetical protein F5Y19DRAFT_471486 [Xylariaceae sp. FL1651]|nr:hypothetical protein F5Y19DRAFT_471486 [Xylariaceae sp. FL1651]
MLVVASQIRSSVQKPCYETTAPPDLEPIEIIELRLPPAAPSSNIRSYSLDVNPLGSGCNLRSGGLVQLGSFLPDSKHVIALVNFTGVPAAPDPASIYDGDQVIIIKADGEIFSNGSPWKCLTCGIPEDNAQGRTDALDYSQSFRDGKRLLVGTNILDCGILDLASDECIPERTYMYPLHWNTAVDRSGDGGTIRELRLHPDSMHIGFNSFTVVGGRLGQYAYMDRIVFNPSPATGLLLSPRYDIVNVTTLFNDATEYLPILIEGGDLVGYPRESSNIDVFAVDLATGVVRRLTSHPGYCDPIDISADGEWIAIMDTRDSNRQEFIAGMRGIPPLTDLINGVGDDSAGSFNDPLRNALADPRFSLDVTRVAYWQTLVQSPACGGENPLSCPNYTEPGGRTERAMLARFTSRQPKVVQPAAPMVETVPWDGLPSGSAKAVFIETPDGSALSSVAVKYNKFSDDGLTILNGFENVRSRNPSIMLNQVDWYSDLVQTGETHSKKNTSEDGFHLTIDELLNNFEANGTLTTTINGTEYTQPANGT